MGRRAETGDPGSPHRQTYKEAPWGLITDAWIPPLGRGAAVVGGAGEEGASCALKQTLPVIRVRQLGKHWEFLGRVLQLAIRSVTLECPMPGSVHALRTYCVPGPRPGSLRSPTTRQLLSPPALDAGVPEADNKQAVLRFRGTNAGTGLAEEGGVGGLLEIPRGACLSAETEEVAAAHP